jgi:hypothetical protein
MNNPGEAPRYPDSPDYTNSETVLNYCSPTGNKLEDQCYYSEHEQNVNEPSERVAGHHSQQPQHQQDYE